MLTILSLCVLGILALCFYDIKLGLPIYLVWYLMVPYSQVQIGGFSLGENFVNTLLLFSFIFSWIRIKRRRFADLGTAFVSKNLLQINKIICFECIPSWRLNALLPFLFYFLCVFVLIFFQNETPLGWQLNYWRQNLMQTILLPIFVFHVMSWEPTTVKSFRKALFVVIFLMAVYGIILMPLHGINPYIMYIQMIKGEDYNMMYALAEGTGRLFGRISSFFSHPMAYGLFLGMSFIYTYFNRKKLKKVYFYTLISIISLNILVCGVRSVIGALGVTVIYYLVLKREIKLIMTVGLIGLIAFFVIMQIQELSEYVGSIIDLEQKHTSVGGSSFSMRLKQMEGCLYEMSSSPITGKGFGWHLYYMGKYGSHPILLCFESLIYIILCDNGILGVLIWILFALLYVFVSKKSLKEDALLGYSLLIFYLVYCCLTGEYNYLRLFMLFYVIMVAERIYMTKTLSFFKKMVTQKCTSNNVS